MENIDAKLVELGITLPEAPAPAANYVPYVLVGDLLFISGQVARNADGFITGRLGDGLEVEAGYQAARTCGLALIAQARAACGGDLGRVKRVVKLGGFVNCTPDFTQQAAVINGASDVMVAVFGEAGRHARTAVGAPSLPLDVAVEIDAVFQLD